MSAGLSKNRLPLHVEISELLAREIEAGILQDGSRLAPERAMADELGVSVGTLRKALLELTQKGLLERVQGSGNYVRRAAQKSQTIYQFFRLELISGGGLPTAKVIAIDRLNKPTDIPSFGISKQGFRIRRHRQLNKHDAAIEEIWIDAPDDREIKVDDVLDSLYLFYRTQLGFWIARAEDQVSVSDFPTWTPKDFGNFVYENHSCGFIERYSYDQNNNLAEFSRTWFDPQSARYVSRIK